ncbi:hypothetical protein JCM10914A_43840 [Paenibacillus sp. JCM 10914]|uniref:VanZ family protein n=1 Tax=Paenibacillus sp. JCM 10914 TaxID=1236974 RepID=UPI0003CC97CE|nr:VanZ family protein [Paenibacillus sp. JCM 10914]GAE07407.1 hypothetical protein JCM10914_3634 [Paenibacillus sp. JCM 10914]
MKKRMYSLLFWSMLAVYLYLLVDLLFLSRGSGSNQRSINLIPFHTISQYIRVDDGIRTKLVDVNVWGNVLIFMPAGIYMMLFRHGRYVSTFFLIMSLSILAEVIQYAFAIGACDIDDVLLNSLGGLIGIGIYALLAAIYHSPERIRKVITVTSTAVGIPVFVLFVILLAANL